MQIYNCKYVARLSKQSLPGMRWLSYSDDGANIQSSGNAGLFGLDRDLSAASRKREAEIELNSRIRRHDTFGELYLRM